MSPADIPDSAQLRAGLARRLAEVGLIPPEHARLRLAPRPDEPPAGSGQDRAAA